MYISHVLPKPLLFKTSSRDNFMSSCRTATYTKVINARKLGIDRLGIGFLLQKGMILSNEDGVEGFVKVSHRNWPNINVLDSYFLLASVERASLCRGSKLL